LSDRRAVPLRVEQVGSRECPTGRANLHVPGGRSHGWIKEGKKESPGGKFRFIAFFLAFNALYWLQWMRDGSKKESELTQIQRLVGKLDASTAKSILAKHRDYVGDMVKRAAIRDMKSRTGTNEFGSADKAEAWRKRLAIADGDPIEKLKALAGILYSIRCNLMHGSKASDESLLRRARPRSSRSRMRVWSTQRSIVPPCSRIEAPDRVYDASVAGASAPKASRIIASIGSRSMRDQADPRLWRRRGERSRGW